MDEVTREKWHFCTIVGGSFNVLGLLYISEYVLCSSTKRTISRGPPLLSFRPPLENDSSCTEDYQGLIDSNVFICSNLVHEIEFS